MSNVVGHGPTPPPTLPSSSRTRAATDRHRTRCGSAREDPSNAGCDSTPGPGPPSASAGEEEGGSDEAGGARKGSGSPRLTTGSGGDEEPDGPVPSPRSPTRSVTSTWSSRGSPFTRTAHSGAPTGVRRGTSSVPHPEPCHGSEGPVFCLYRSSLSPGSTLSHSHTQDRRPRHTHVYTSYSRPGPLPLESLSVLPGSDSGSRVRVRNPKIPPHRPGTPVSTVGRPVRDPCRVDGDDDRGDNMTRTWECPVSDRVSDRGLWTPTRVPRRVGGSSDPGTHDPPGDSSDLGWEERAPPPLTPTSHQGLPRFGSWTYWERVRRMTKTFTLLFPSSPTLSSVRRDRLPCPSLPLLRTSPRGGDVSKVLPCPHTPCPLWFRDHEDQGNGPPHIRRRVGGEGGSTDQSVDRALTPGLGGEGPNPTPST